MLLQDYLGDVVLDMASWANRPDLLSVIGVAREVAALTGQSVVEPPATYEESGEPAAARLSVAIADPDLCSRYIGMVIDGVRIGPSPAWMQERLAAAGMRPINTVVDITNYVMLEYGQPLHAFDYDRVGGRQIIVRRARPGEALVTIDGAEQPLTPDMLVIADAERPVALAGVMGGQDSEVSDATTTVLLEAATFNGTSVRRTATRLKMRTEASARFEKGLPADLAEVAARRAAALFAELAGGRVAPGMVDTYAVRQEPAAFDVPAERLRRVLGIEIPPGRVQEVLRALGLGVEWTPPDRYRVSVPYWRPDVRIPDDIAEELIRIVGYDDLPTTTINGRIPPPLPQPARELRERVRDVLAAAGMQEVWTYSLVSLEQLRRVVPPEELALTPPLHVANPLSPEREYMRTSVRGGPLEALARHLKVRRGEAALFETAVSYQPRDSDLPEERETLIGVVGGRRLDRWGQASDEPVDFFDAKGYLDALFEHLGVDAECEPASEFGLLPGRTAAIRLDGRDIGVAGQVHPDTAAAFEVEGDAYLFEIRLDLLREYTGRPRGYRPYSSMPSVQEDLSVVVDASVSAEQVARVIRQGRYVVAVHPFDEYTGEPIPAGKKSLSFAVSYQDPERTLTDAEVQGSWRRIVEALRGRLGATLR
jgi:phenylalanyl-tRNA synthetase beta chain